MPHAPARCAAIDVGSHSTKLTIADRSPAGWRPVLEQVEVTGLGRGEARREGLDADACRRTLAVLAEFASRLRKQEIVDVVVAGTAVLRQASDAGSFVATVRQQTGLALEVISGPEEARLTYLGAVTSLPPLAGGTSQLVFDIGGASTELAWGHDDAPVDRRSLDLGTISLARSHGLDTSVAAERIAAAVASVVEALACLPPIPAPARLVGIGATPATLMALDRERDIADSAEVHATLLDRCVITRQIARLQRLDTADRRRLPGLHPGRAEVVLAGAAITAAVAARWPDPPLILSGRGLRDGLLRDRFGSGR